MSHQLVFPDVPIGTTIGPVEESFHVDINGAIITAYLRSSLNVTLANAEASNVAELGLPNGDGDIRLAWWQIGTTGLAPGHYWLDVIMLRNGVSAPLGERQQINLLPQ